MIILKLIHKLVWWLPLALVSLTVKILSPFLGLVLAWFVKSNGELPSFLTYCSPDDTPAIGDYMFQTREGAFADKYPAYLRRVLLCYLWSFTRNAGWGADSKAFGIPASIGILHWFGTKGAVDWGYDDVTGKAVYHTGLQFIIGDKGYWNLRFAFVIPFTNRGLLCSFGWNLLGSVIGKRNLKIDVALMNTDRNGYSK